MKIFDLFSYSPEINTLVPLNPSEGLIKRHLKRLPPMFPYLNSKMEKSLSKHYFPSNE